MGSPRDYDEDRRDDGLIDRLSGRNIDAKHLLEESRLAKKYRLEQELVRIREQLEGREVIHADIVEDQEFRVDLYTKRLEDLYTTGRGMRNGERRRLKDKIESFYQALREEHRQQWRDLQDLEQDRREVLRELEELRDTSLEDLL